MSIRLNSNPEDVAPDVCPHMNNHLNKACGWQSFLTVIIFPMMSHSQNCNRRIVINLE